MRLALLSRQDTYRLGITSDAWARRRSRYYTTHRRLCRACLATLVLGAVFGFRRKVELHHRTYRWPIGNEPDRALVPLCRRHHRRADRLRRMVPSVVAGRTWLLWTWTVQVVGWAVLAVVAGRAR